MNHNLAAMVGNPTPDPLGGTCCKPNGMAASIIQSAPNNCAPGQCGPSQCAPKSCAPGQCGPSQSAPKSCAPGQCGPSQCAPGSSGPVDTKGDETRQMVEQYYGSVLQSTADLRTNACCTPGAAQSQEIKDIISKVPAEITNKYYGCGYPIPPGIRGLRVLDLGCGTGRDCYVCAALVGPTGFVTGIDMTESQLAVAQAYTQSWASMLGYPKSNLRFVKGTIENLQAAGVAESSVDLVISNCVINLSPDKAQVLREAYRALAPGGEMHFSDVYCDRRLPQEMRSHQVLVGECLGGALYIHDFYAICRRVGFLNPRILAKRQMEVHSPELEEMLGEARFCSVTFRLFKLPGLLEDASEDYGQVATYKGGIPGHPGHYELDIEHKFYKGKPALVDGNTAAMLSDSWLRHYFSVTGDRSVHYGAFPTESNPRIPA